MKFIFAFAFLAIVCYTIASPVPTDEAGPQKLVQLARANDEFGLQLLHRLELAEKAKAKHDDEPKNLFISPFSVSSVMSLLMASSANKTYEEIRKTLAFAQTLTDSDINANYQTLLKGLNQAFAQSDNKNELQVANSIALQDKYKLLQSFLDVASKNFDSKIFNVDFATKAHEATEEINKWVAEKTKGKIEKLFKQDLDSATTMVLLNAIYFKGVWKYPFDPERTAPGEFKLGQNKTASVSMMNLSKRRFRNAQFDDGELLELLYQGDELSMLIFLPKQDLATDSLSSQFAGIAEQSKTKLAERLAALRNTSINVVMPKFKIEAGYSLTPTLKSMGILEAFDTANADLSRIDGGRSLVVADVVHKATVEVNEEGSVAAAVTGVVVHTKSGLVPRRFVVDRPFLFLIRDNARQLTLFAGVVNKP